MPGTTVFCRSTRTQNEMDNGRLCHSTPAFLQSRGPAPKREGALLRQVEEAAQPALLPRILAVWLTESLQVWCGIRPAAPPNNFFHPSTLFAAAMVGHSTSSAAVTHPGRRSVAFSGGHRRHYNPFTGRNDACVFDPGAEDWSFVKPHGPWAMVSHG